MNINGTCYAGVVRLGWAAGSLGAFCPQLECQRDPFLFISLALDVCRQHVDSQAHACPVIDSIRLVGRGWVRKSCATEARRAARASSSLICATISLRVVYIIAHIVRVRSDVRDNNMLQAMSDKL